MRYMQNFKMSILLLLLLNINPILTNQRSTGSDVLSKSDSNSKYTARKLIFRMLGLLIANSNHTILFENVLSDVECFATVNHLYFNNSESALVDTIISNSGKSGNDDGSEEGCISTSQHTYLFLTFKENFSNRYRDESINKFFIFNEKNLFHIGLCLLKKCNKLYPIFFDPKINKKFFNFLTSNYSVYDLKLYYMNYLDDDNIQYRDRQILNDNEDRTIYIIFRMVFVIYLIFRCITTILCLILYKVNSKNNIDISRYNNRTSGESISLSRYLSNSKSYSTFDLDLSDPFLSPVCYFKDKKPPTISCSSDVGSINISSFEKLEDDSITDGEIENKKEKFNINKLDLKNKKEKIFNNNNIESSNFNDKILFNNKLLGNSNESNIKRTKYVLSHKFCKIFSIYENLKILFLSKSKYYDDTNLEIFRGVRFYTLFLLSLNESIQNVEKIPHNNFYGYSFYSSACFFVVKYSTYGYITFIVLNGINLGFKLMNYVKNKQGVFNFKEMTIFIFKFLPSFFFLLFTFYVMYMFVIEIGCLFNGSRVLFEYLVSTQVNNKKCIKEPFSIFIPFYFSYFTESIDYKYSICFKYIHMVISEFHCFIFFIIIFYFSNKIKSKKLDITITILNFLNLSLCFFYYDDFNNAQYYSISRVMGEVYTIQKPHIFIIPYFLGINIGIMWFYYKDIITSNPLSFGNVYYPFGYNFYIMRFFDKISNKFKIFITFVSSVLIFLLCSTFSFIIWYNNKCNCISDILVKFTPSIRILFIYEGKIFLLLNILLIISILFYNGDIYLKKLMCSKLFIPINKIYFAFLYLNDAFNYFFFSNYNVYIYLNMTNTILASFALMAFVLVFSCISVVLFELPLRIIYKKLFSNTRIEKKLNFEHKTKK